MVLDRSWASRTWIYRKTAVQMDVPIAATSAGHDSFCLASERFLPRVADGSGLGREQSPVFLCARLHCELPGWYAFLQKCAQSTPVIVLNYHKWFATLRSGVPSGNCSCKTYRLLRSFQTGIGPARFLEGLHSAKDASPKMQITKKIT